MLSENEFKSSPLFSDISYDEYLTMMHCFHVESRVFGPLEVISDYSLEQKNQFIGMIASGSAALIRTDMDGIETVLEELKPGGVFGKTLAFDSVQNDVLYVIATAECEVQFIDYDSMFKRCEKACNHHSILVSNMLSLISEKARRLSERVDVLSRRSIREKLLCYFRQVEKLAGSSYFELPFSLSMLADYIAVDRSAMMRELKRMKNENVISYEKRYFHLYKHEN